jgi:hypothetical protein
VCGEGGRDWGGSGGVGTGLRGEVALETAAEGVVQEEVLNAQDKEGVFRDLTVGEGLLEGLDEAGNGLALFGVHPGFALGEVVEGHGGVSS